MPTLQLQPTNVRSISHYLFLPLPHASEEYHTSFCIGTRSKLHFLGRCLGLLGRLVDVPLRRGDHAAGCRINSLHIECCWIIFAHLNQLIYALLLRVWRKWAREKNGVEVAVGIGCCFDYASAVELVVRNIAHYDRHPEL